MHMEPARLMLYDVSRELLERAKNAKADAAQSRADYDRGRQFAFYEVISLLTQQADAFGLDRASIGLEGVNADQDLLGT